MPRRFRLGWLLASALLLVAACQNGGGDDQGSTDRSETDAGDTNPGGGGLSFSEHPDLVGAADLDDLEFVVTAAGDATVDDLGILLDGEPVDDDVHREPGRLVYAPDGLPDGDRVVAVRTLPSPEDEDAAEADLDDAGDEVGGEVVHEWRLTVDTVPPELELTSPDGALVVDEPVMVEGGTEPDATVTVNGTTLEVDDDGRFAGEWDLDGERDLDGVELTVTAIDPAGNTTEVALDLVVVPSRVAMDEVRGVHVSFWGWAASSLREPVLELVEEGRINTVQLDLKDEAGEVGYDSEVGLAQEIGAVQGIYDLEEAVRELHDRGVHVVGRIVAFRDPILAAWAWDEGRRDMVIQTPDGQPYAGYGGFSSFADPDVVEYNLAVAEEAAAAGVDAILWDYIRRPDGPAENLVVPGLPADAGDGAMERAIVDFTAMAEERLAPYGVDHGVSVYGIAATRPHEIAQDIPGMARHVDYVAPMVYPSHWGPGEYGVDDPNRQPYDIVFRSLRGFVEQVEGTGARVVPWLEDTTYRAWDRREQVREQIRAALDHGIDEWLMWDPRVRYTTDAYPPRD